MSDDHAGVGQEGRAVDHLHRGLVPVGKDDPSIVIIKVSGNSAPYWESPGRVLTSASALKARATGLTPDSGESASVDLSDA